MSKKCFSSTIAWWSCYFALRQCLCGRKSCWHDRETGLVKPLMADDEEDTTHTWHAHPRACAARVSIT